MRSLKLTLAGIAAAALLGVTAGTAADPVRGSASPAAPVSNWASILLRRRTSPGMLGKSYVFEPVRYRGHAADDHGAGEQRARGRQPRLFARSRIAIQNAGMDDLRVIADEFRDGVDGYYSQEYMVLADGPIKKVEDLKGKVVATNAAGSAVDVATRAMLRKFGLEDKRDYTVVEAPFPTMRAMLAEKKVDLIPGVLPFSLDPELRKISRPLFIQRDAHRRDADDRRGRRASRSSTRTAPPWSTSWRTRCASCAGISTRRTIRRSCEIAGARHQAAGRALRLAVHQEGRLPRSQHAARPRGAADATST